MKTVDLHVHSNCSDGTYTPEELVDYALEKNLTAFALTDHDTVAGITRAREQAKGTTLSVITGVELSSQYFNRDIHIVGLDFDEKSLDFQEHLLRFQESREERNRKMILLLQKQKFDITEELMFEAFGDAIWTRAHFARLLLDKGYVKTMKEAFQLYLGDHAPCYVPREKITSLEAVHAIQKAGGIPVLAHPLLYRFSEGELDALLSKLKKAGLIGIEALYSTHSQADENFVRWRAKMHGLCISGGSDFHGSNKPDIDLGCGRGNLKIPVELWKRLQDAR